MEDTNVGINQGSPGQGGTSKPSSKPRGKDGQGERGNRQPDKPGARPTPSGVPNEGRRMESEGGNQKSNQSDGQQSSRDGQGGMQTPGHGGEQQGGRQGSAGSPGQTERPGREGYEYKGGRQGQGGIPNPDDVDDDESAGSFRGTAELNIESDVEQSIAADQKRNEDLNSPLRNP